VSQQQSLFDEPEDDAPNALARSSDPATSQDAGVAIAPYVADLQVWTGDCVRKSPGLTARELAQIYCPTDPRKLGRRLAECERLGLVRRGEARACSVSGRHAETWLPVVAGTGSAHE
jgi:hypothetical protein